MKPLHLLVALSLCALVLNFNVDAQQTMVLTSLDNNIQNVDVSPDSNGQVQFTGTCDAVFSSTDPIQVELFVNSTIGDGMVTPYNFNLTTAEQSMNFTATVTIPTGTSSSLTPLITVFGFWTQNGNTRNVSESSAQVVVLEYYQVHLTCLEQEKVADGGGGQFMVTVANNGNCDDEYSAAVENKQDLEDQDIFISPIPDFEIAEGEDETLLINVLATDNADKGEYVLELEITSKGSNQAITDEIELTFVLDEESPDKDNGTPGFELNMLIFALMSLMFINKAGILTRKQ